MTHSEDNPQPDANPTDASGAAPASGESVPPAEAPAATSTAAVPAGPELPEDLRAPWTWGDLVILFFFGLGSSIALSYLLVWAAYLWFGLQPQDIEKLARAKTTFVIAHQAVWSGAMLLYLFGVIRARFGAPFWRTVGWREIRSAKLAPSAAYLLCVLGGFMLAVVIQMASAFVGTKAKLPIEEFFRDRQSVLLLMGMGILVAPVVEETIFRGYIYPVLARTFGVPGGVLGTGVVFGLAHAMQLWGGWGQIVLLMVVGIVFTYVRARTGTVFASYFLHLGYNSILFLAFYFFTGGLEHLPGSPP